MSSACDMGRPPSSICPRVVVRRSTCCFLNSVLNSRPPMRTTATKKRWMMVDCIRGAD